MLKKYFMFFSFVLLMISGCSKDPFNEGKLAFEAGDFHRANDFFQQALLSSSETAEILYYLAVSDIRLGNYDSSISRFDQLLSMKNPGESIQKKRTQIMKTADKVIFARALDLAKSGKKPEAADMISRLYRSDYPSAFYLALFERETGDYLSAIDLFKTAFNASEKRDNNSFICDLKYELSKTYLEKFRKNQDQEDFYNAVREIRKALIMNHPDQERRFQIDQYYTELRNERFYLEHYAPVQDAVNRIELMLKSQDFSGFKQDIDLIVSTSPLNEDLVYAYLAVSKQALYHEDNPEKALESYRKALKILEGDSEAIPLRLMDSLGEEIRQKMKDKKQLEEK